MRTGPRSDWTEDRIDLCFKLWADGVSASQIAKQLGGVTRNAVLGKIHRAGMSVRASPPVPKKAPKVAKSLQPKDRPSRGAGHPWMAGAIQPAPKPPEPPKAGPPPEGPGTATILTLGRRSCRWPIGDPLEATFTLCGRRAAGGRYCVEHDQLAFQPAKAKHAEKELLRSVRRYL
jgi:GcrA cell cycle regulator